MHNPDLQRMLANARARELQLAAREHRGSRRSSPNIAQVPPGGALTLRFAFPDDALALSRLAALDSGEVPAQPVLLAEVDGEMHAALSLTDGQVVADPFRRTVALVALLRARAQQLVESERGGRRRLLSPRRVAVRSLRRLAAR